MAKDVRWTSSETEQRQRNYKIADKELLSIPKKPLYHYTSRDVFWKIMDGESMLARHIMFSNDYHENEIGKNKIADAMQKVANLSLTETNALPFMICFCEDGDLLSQWRGYANEGIALEFDFTKGLYGSGDSFSTDYCYTVTNKDPEGEYLSKLKDGKTEIFMGAVISPYAVVYTNKDESSDESVVSMIDTIKTGFLDSIQQTAISMIPYIKNNKFSEEAEYRLIFDMNQLAAGEYQRLLSEKYVYLDVDGVRKPNIRVKFGNQYKAQYEENVTIYYVDDEFEDAMKDLKKECKAEKIKIELIKKKRKFKLNSKEILISEGKNQERVSISLHKMLADKNVKVWCDGHLPIRRIIVGPSKDAELMKKSIEEYIKTKYWARDIEVDISGIPLRT